MQSFIDTWGRQSYLQPPFRRLVRRLKAGYSNVHSTLAPQDWLPHKHLFLILISMLPAPAAMHFQVLGSEPGAWPGILASIGLLPASEDRTEVFVIPRGVEVPVEQWLKRIDEGAVVVLEGESPLAESHGFKPGSAKISTRSTVDERAPKLPIIWEKTELLPVFEIGSGTRIFVRERWSKAPLMAGIRRGNGAVLWIAAGPGVQGHERFPYLPQALAEMGASSPFRGNSLWAFFDSSYRLRVDVDYFAERWRRAGISALHVAAWHYYEPDPGRDEYLRKLIEACHRHAITVYAWLELPHVSEKFWGSHPEWREKTALLQDAHLDWRRLMNLANPDCAKEVDSGVQALMQRFDWDGANLAELYYESLEGMANPARFTPMNDDVRRGFKAMHGLDPIELFKTKNEPMTRAFLDYRAELARNLQSDWLAKMEAVRSGKPQLDIVLTHVDDQFDTRMRDLIGADAARVLPLLDKHDFTFLIEDPATIWHLGPSRYPKIAERYLPLTPHREKLAIDINIVERYQDVYPTKQQTGTELFQLVHLSTRAFQTVALYFENSIATQDLTLLPASASTVTSAERGTSSLTVESQRGAGLLWNGAAKVNGHLWPVMDGRTLWLPPGKFTIEPSEEDSAIHVVDLNASLLGASASPAGIEFSYRSAGRALAIVDRRPSIIEIDGAKASPEIEASNANWLVKLPRGEHVVVMRETAVAGIQ